MQQHYYLLRHGQSQANAKQIIAGAHDSPLSPLGQKQAEFASETAKLYFPLDLIVSSPLSRSSQTADIIATHIGYPKDKIILMDELRERDLGVLEGQEYHTAQQHNGNYEDAENVPGIEPLEKLFARVNVALQRLRDRPERRILIVCHNGSGRMLKVAFRSQKPIDMYQQPRLDNAIFYRLS